MSSVYASVRMFSGFSFYDDEGSLLLMSRWLLDGHSVYGEFNSIYGPFYFLYEWTAHMLLGGSASHSTARLLAVVPWVLTCTVAFGYTLRTTASRAAALVAWLAVLRTLAFLTAEPGHPQEICVLLIVGLVVIAARPRPACLGAVGASVAALALTKINLGLFAGAGLLLALVSVLPAGRGRQMAVALVGTLCVATPTLLMLPLLDTAWVLQCCAVLTLSILSVVGVLAAGRPDRSLVWPHWRALISGFLVCVALVLTWSLAQGASLITMLHSTVLANLEQSHTWTVPLYVGIPGVLACAAGVISAVLWLKGWRGFAFEWLRMLIGVSTLILVMANRPVAAFTIGLPFVWMVLPPGRSTRLTRWPRSVLAAVTVMHALIIYPVAGSQLRFTTVLIAIAATQMAHDAWTVLGRDPSWSIRTGKPSEG